MIMRVQNFVMVALFALFSLFWAQSFVSQNPISGGYQFFEQAASGDFAHNPLNVLDKFFPPPKTAPECCNAPKGGLCSFDGSTLVLTEDGFVAIEDINTNMSVWSRDADTGAMDWKRVEAQYSNPYDETVSVTIRDLEGGAEQTIVSNRIHPYFVQTERKAVNSEGHEYHGAIQDGQWIDAGNLEAGDRLLNDDESWAEVMSVKIEAKPLEAYNLTVSDFHTYFVAANDNAEPVWVHNDCFDANFPSRNAALRGAKEQVGVPRTQQPKDVYYEKLKDPKSGEYQRYDDGTIIETRNYVYDHPKYGQIVIKEHSVGHPAYKGMPAGKPHFNVEKYHGQIGDNPHQTTSISGISGHYTF